MAIMSNQKFQLFTVCDLNRLKEERFVKMSKKINHQAQIKKTNDKLLQTPSKNKNSNIWTLFMGF